MQTLTEMDMSKEELRIALRARRRSLTAQEQAQAEADIWARLREFAPYCKAGSVMAYMACRGEASLAPAIEDVLARGVTLALPRCEADGVMTARRVTSPAQLEPGFYGLPEPGRETEILAPQDIGLILVPGVAFDRRGGRLGQGGGYYDRFLAKTKAVRVGICHDFALLERVPTRAHDLTMDCVITPGGIYPTGGAKERTGDTGRI